MMVRVVWCALLLLGCESQGELDLLVDVRTDLLPGLEFDRVELDVSHGGDVVRGNEVDASIDDDYLSGVRVGSFSVVPGAYELRARLLLRSRIVASSRALIRVSDAPVGVTLTLTRNCSAGQCPEAADSRLTECLDGRCVAPQCSSLAPEECGPLCEIDTDCTEDVVTDCEARVCRGGICLVEARHSLCSGDELCVPSRGCVALALDGGVSDASPFDAGPSDAEVVDAGSADSGSSDVGMDAGPVASLRLCSREGFEEGLPSYWTVDDSSPWFATSDDSESGGLSMRSGPLGADGLTSISVELTSSEDGMVAFALRVECEYDNDRISFSIDGIERGFWSGVVDWQVYEFPIRAGSHTLTWTYRKASDPDNGSDTTLGADSIWLDSVEVKVQPGSSSTGFESSVLPTGYTTYGAAGWLQDTGERHSGSASLRSGPIREEVFFNRESILERPVWIGTGGGTVAFWSRASTAAFRDLLTFSIDGVEMGEATTGEEDWYQQELPVSSGFHTLRWRYVKSNFPPMGADTVWLDDILVTNEIPAPSTCP